MAGQREAIVVEEPYPSNAHTTKLEFQPIYVAGYLALYDMGDGGDLTLTRDVVGAALPPAASPLPINIDHKTNCEIGAVLAIVDDERGPFFLGKINCPQLGDVLASAASSEVFGSKSSSLTDGEKLLYLVTNYLPSASLSSRRLAPGDVPDDTLLSHVALCVIGRRVGTIVTYDLTASSVVEPFKFLSKQSRDEILREAQITDDMLAGRMWSPGEEVLARALLATAVNNMLLRDRWEVVSRRRKQAGISGHTYLQASAKFGFGWNNDVLTEQKKEVREGLSENAALQEHLKKLTDDTERAIVRSDISKHRSNSFTCADMSTPPPPPSRIQGDGDYMWVPCSQYNQLLNGAGVARPQSTVGSTTPLIQQPYMQPMQYVGAVPQMQSMYGYVPNASWGSSPLETQLAAFLCAMAADRRASSNQTSTQPPIQQHNYQQTPAASLERRSCRKRRADWDLYEDDHDETYFPGEMRDSRQVAGTKAQPDNLAGQSTAKAVGAISGLIEAVSSLQQEIGQLRSIHNQQAQLPTQQMIWTPPAAQPAYLPQPMQVPVVQANVKPAQSQIQEPVQNKDDVAAQSAVMQPSSSSTTTVDASLVTGLDRDRGRRDDADIFVTQMMSQR
ncbi:capsid maturation protease [Spheniscid alphaherpesvirus 1]|uniref:Capsid scaffolding protein n=2 Tax=Spheniscid alphaherpesvirus 1 TaxID=2560777 RepID=A0A1R3TF95_9ALPH|nr:capsid maturation protease [Spheniscid alphaherpesvirus 1]